MPVTFKLEHPALAEPQDPSTLRMDGWLHGGDRHAEIAAIEVYASNQLLGDSECLYPRAEIAASLRIPPQTRLGFSLCLNAPTLLGRNSVELEFRIRLRDASRLLAGRRTMPLLPTDHRQAPYGGLVDPATTRLFHRADIYGSGPSVHDINPDCIGLIRRYLGPTPRRVLDVGCGFGGYGRALRADGHDWFGVEVKASDCAELTRLDLPHQQVDGQTLPFEAASFDDAICIEVIEHIEKPAEFLAEIQRVIRRRLLVSVPNLELIPYLHPYAVVPWHLLEADHKNFFSRASLRHLLSQHFRRVEVLDYAPLPLRSLHGLPLNIHLFAICDI